MRYCIGIRFRRNRWQHDRWRDGAGRRRPYDYESIMHFPPNAFSMNGKPTIEPLLPDIKIGGRDKLSAGDILLINAPYPTVPTVR